MTSCRHARAVASRAHVGVVVPQTTKHSVFAADGTVWTVADLDLQAPITHFEMGVTGNAVYMAVSEEQGQGLRVMQLVL